MSNRVYGDLMPPQPQDGPAIWDYGIMKKVASFPGYFRTDLSEDVALRLAELSPCSSGVKLGVRKQLANDKALTLRQMSILLGWAADRAMRR